MWELIKLIYQHPGILGEMLLVAGLGLAIAFIGLRASDRFDSSLLWVVGGSVLTFLLVVFVPHGYSLFEMNYLHQPDAVARSFDPANFDENQLWLLVKTHFWVALVGYVIGVFIYLKKPNL